MARVVIRDTVSRRPVVFLGAAAVALMGLGVWLFREVNSSPAEAGVPVGPVETPAPTQVKLDPIDDKPATAPRPADWSAAMRPKPGSDTHVAAPPPAARIDHPPALDDGSGGVPEKLPEKADAARWDAMLSEVNKAYDRGDYDEAKSDAIRVLKKDPSNVRMLRVVVSSACITGDATEAQQWFEKLTDKRDRDQMRTRCDRYQVTLADPK